MLMFTRGHVVTHRSEGFEAVLEGHVVRLLVAEGPLEAHQEGIREDLLGRGRGDQHRRSQTLQPHVRAVPSD